MPHTKLPRKRFQHKEDAKAQIQKAVEYYNRCFGRSPNGMWPSEGSVSDEVVTLMSDAGVKWIATDESILFLSHKEINGQRHKLYHAYNAEIQGSNVAMIFRDHALSDAIGFIYQKWDPAAAAADFIKKLHHIRDIMPENTQDALVSVILDGENCWEYYSNDGWDFLRKLYHALSNDPGIETVRVSDFIEKHAPQTTLKKIWPGSWINANYAIWIGHAEDNTAWDYLRETRHYLSNYCQNHPDKAEAPEVKAAWERIYIAEGSDWNWWYGDDHGSDNDETFDFLFRQNLISVYELLREKTPDYLHKSIKGIIHKSPTLEPIDFITPVIDGKVTNYFEWQAAGSYKVGHSGGSMHQVDTLLDMFYYGFDLENLYLRFDPKNETKDGQEAGISIKVVFLNPENTSAEVVLGKKWDIPRLHLSANGASEKLEKVAYGRVLELAIPIEKLKLTDDSKTLEFVIIVERDGMELERWPYESSVILPKPTKEFTLKNWSV